MPAPPLRVLTLNLQHGRPAAGASGPAGLRAAAREIAALAPDLLLLQEVDKHQRRSDRIDQAALLARELGLPHARFVASFAGPAGGLHRRPCRSDVPGAPGYGVAILSRHPVASWHVRRLTRASPRLVRRPGRGLCGRRLAVDGARVCLAATVQTPAGPLSVAVTHLSTHEPAARRQLAECWGALSTLPAPQLLGGDLNLEPTALAGLTPMVSLVERPTFTNARPRRQLDHLLGSVGVVATAGAAHHLSVSDHAGLSADVRLRSG